MSNNIAGQKSFFFIQGVDQFGNNMTSGGAVFVVKLSSDSSASISVNDTNTGLYIVNYMTTVATNSAQWTITLGGAAIKNSPVATSVSPGPLSPANCVC